AFAQLTVCSGSACDRCGLHGGKHWCWSSRQRSLVASRRAPSVPEPSLGPATGKTTHRFGRASPHPAHGRGEPSLGRSADPRRAAEARNRRLGRTVSRYLAKIELAVTRSQPPAAVCLSLLSKRVANGLGQQLQRRL